ncbi:hypothetical protein [Parasphingorhabdus sp.]|uniref:hypothetical protein n=1 Tax=Parasphingorhabdus sp. TaxID=2709688 RepID=UPI003D2DE4DE
MSHFFTFSRFRKTNPATYLVALLALIISALAPSGFMPTRTEQGFAIKLCSGHADSQLAITPDHPDYATLALIYGQQDEPVPESGPEAPAQACVFSGGASIGLASSAPEFDSNIIAPATHEPSEPRRFALRNRINIPPATGPPVIV